MSLNTKESVTSLEPGIASIPSQPTNTEPRSPLDLSTLDVSRNKRISPAFDIETERVANLEPATINNVPWYPTDSGTPRVDATRVDDTMKILGIQPPSHDLESQAPLNTRTGSPPLVTDHHTESLLNREKSPVMDMTTRDDWPMLEVDPNQTFSATVTSTKELLRKRRRQSEHVRVRRRPVFRKPAKAIDATCASQRNAMDDALNNTAVMSTGERSESEGGNASG